jgi:integrase
MTDNNTERLIGDKLARRLGDDAEAVNEQFVDWHEWMTTRGKNHVKQDGLSSSHADNLLSRLDQVHRFTIDYLDIDDPTVITPDDADEVLLLLARDVITQTNGDTYAEGAKRKFSNALSKYLEWRFREGSVEFQWQPRIKFSDNRKAQTKAATFSIEELGWLFDVARDYKSLPSYYDTSAEQQDRIDALVAQRLSIPKSQVSRQERLEADFSTKIWSLVTVAYDCGLIPVEIQRATVDWYKPQEQAFVVPHKQAAKERESYRLALSDESAEALTQWIRERRHLKKYDGRDELWLNRKSNPYDSGSLNSMIRNLCEEADIVKESQPVRWYSLRRSMVMHMKSEGSLEEAGDQARHDRLETTQEDYPNTPTDKRRNTLNTTRDKATRAASDPEYDPYETDSPMASRGSGNSDGESEDVVSRAGENGMHIDAVIQSNRQAKSEVVEKVWRFDDSDQE